ncbi:MAG: hypothetical protein OXN27_06645 [Candidatus Poribacteria bacterium]|nr:hypothetical protein [Candidatus Poribacteria bacterium]
MRNRPIDVNRDKAILLAVGFGIPRMRVHVAFSAPSLEQADKQLASTPTSPTLHTLIILVHIFYSITVFNVDQCRVFFAPARALHIAGRSR